MSEEKQLGYTQQLKGWTRATIINPLENIAGIRHIRFHDLRHTFNTRLMEAGVMQEIRKALMGHSSGSEINAIYTHIELPTKRRAIEMLEAWCKERRPPQTESEVNRESEQQTLSAGTVDVLPERTELGESSD